MCDLARTGQAGQDEPDQDNGKKKKGEGAWLPRIRKMDIMNYLS